MSKRRYMLVVLFVLTHLAAAACTQLQPANPDPGVDLSDPNVGGGVGEETGPQTPISAAAPANETSPRLDATAETLATYPPASPTFAPARDLPVATPAPPMPATESIPAPAETPAPPAGEEPGESGVVIHVVKPGENLYQIGLIYGISWVTIAEFNGIANPDAIAEGQEIRIPPTPQPTPAAETTDN